MNLIIACGALLVGLILPPIFFSSLITSESSAPFYILMILSACAFWAAAYLITGLIRSHTVREHSSFPASDCLYLQISAGVAGLSYAAGLLLHKFISYVSNNLLLSLMSEELKPYKTFHTLSVIFLVLSILAILYFSYRIYQATGRSFAWFSEAISPLHLSIPHPEVGWVCPGCGKKLPDGQRFCPNCGTKRPEAARCSGCGAPLAPGIRFCPSCGKAVADSGHGAVTPPPDDDPKKDFNPPSSL